MPSPGKEDTPLPLNDHDQMLWESLTAIDRCERYNAWLAGQFVPHLDGDVIEIGSGIGSLAKYYNGSSVRSALLTDISPLMLRRLEERFASNPKCQIRKLDILTQTPLPTDLAGHFDCLISLNVLEHIVDDRKALVRMYELLKPGGHLLLLVPALPFLYGTIDRAAGHFRRYSKGGMLALTRDVGFEPTSVYYLNFFGILTWLISSRLLRLQYISVAGCRILDNMVPFLRFLESGLKPPWGQSLVYIGKKSSLSGRG